MTIPPRPFLKWAGGKGRLLAQYQPYLPTTFRTYYEPFLGGGALFFHLQPQQAVLSDINPELVNVYTCVRDRVEEVIQCLQIHKAQHCRDYYYEIRGKLRGDVQENGSDASVERAARLIYLNKTCFNGLYRVNAQGLFNVPMGRYKNPNICDPLLLHSASIALQGTKILHRPFERVVQDATSSQDFVYFDPPYHPLTATSNFTSYSRYAFTAENQLQLRNTFAQLASQGVQALLSNSDCPLIRDLYQDFPIQTIAAARSINSDPSKRSTITEVLVMSGSLGKSDN